MIETLSHFFVQDIYCYTQLVVDQVYVPFSLLLYAHIPSAVITLFAGTFLLYRDRRLESKVFFALSITFFLFTMGDLAEWFVFLGRSTVMFARATIEIADPLLFVFGSYLLYVLINKKDAPTWCKILWLAPFPFVAAFIFSGQNLIAYNWQVCEAVESPLITQFGFYVDLVYMTAALLFAVWSIIKSKGNRLQVTIVSIGVCSFIVLFFVMEYVFTGYVLGLAFDYNYFLYAFIGMPVLVAFLAYLTIRYKIFDLKVITTEVGMAGIFSFVLAQYFFLDNKTAYILNTVALIALAVLSRIVIRSVKLEIQHREEIERLAATLDETNGRQETLIHFIGHEVKGFLTKDTGAFSSLLDGDFAPLPETLKPFVTRALLESRGGADSVAQILKASNLKKGTVTYAKDPFDLKVLVAAAVENAKLGAEQKGLTITFTADEGAYQMVGDAPQLADHVLRNLIDNAVNYTPAGTIVVALKRDGAKIIFSVKDSGVGITDEDKKRLFTEAGHGADSQKINAHSTGYGLYIAKQIVDAHGGTIRAESEGAGRGSTFIAEFPAE